MQVDLTEEVQIGDELTITPLGAGQEVGRSCIVVKYRGHTIMLDCGIHPGYMETAGLPFFDAIDPASVDLLLITHFHIDHCAAVPWFLMQTGFHGKCYMTHATKAIFKILLADYVRVAGGSNEQNLFNKIDVERCLPLITAANYHQVINYNGIKISCYNAGHVFGACMWMIDIDGVRVLYTGDFSLEDERHLKGAEIPPISPDVLIIESTHGIVRNEGRLEREYRFTEYVKRIVERGGRCLIPIFALGRVQELLLILEEYWSAHEHLQSVPVYFGSSLTKKSMAVYNNFRTGMTDAPVSARCRFDFKYIKYMKSTDELDDSGPCVVLAAPAMLQNGMSRILFDRWASNPLNGVIIPGYTVENTLAKQLLNGPKEVPTMTGQMIPMKCSVHSVSFSGHSDFTHTSKFIESLKTKRVVLVHGVAAEMERLRDRLTKDFSYFDIEVATPGDCEAASFTFKSNPTADIHGSLLEKVVDKAEGEQMDKSTISGLIVKRGFSYMIVAPQELMTYSTLHTLDVTNKQQVQATRSLAEYKEYFERYFEGVSMVIGGELMTIGDSCLKLEQGPNNMISIEWRSDPMSDMVADNVAMMLSCADPTRLDEDTDELFTSKLTLALQCRWGNDIHFDEDEQAFRFQVNDTEVGIYLDPDASNGVHIECDDADISDTIGKLALRLFTMSRPVALPKAL